MHQASRIPLEVFSKEECCFNKQHLLIAGQLRNTANTTCSCHMRPSEKAMSSRFWVAKGRKSMYCRFDGGKERTVVSE